MRILCYRSNCVEQREVVWRIIQREGWMTDHWIYTLFYVPERLESLVLCADSGLIRLPELDYIV